MKINSLTMASNGNVSHLSQNQGLVAENFLALFLMLLGQGENTFSLSEEINKPISPEEEKTCQGGFLALKERDLTDTNNPKEILKNLNLKNLKIKTEDSSEESPENIIAFFENILKEINYYFENLLSQEAEGTIKIIENTIKDLKSDFKNLINFLKENTLTDRNKEVFQLNDKERNNNKLEQILTHIKNNLESLEKNISGKEFSEQEIISAKKLFKKIENSIENIWHKSNNFQKTNNIEPEKLANNIQAENLKLDENINKNKKKQIQTAQNIYHKEKISREKDPAGNIQKEFKKETLKNNDSLIENKLLKEKNSIKENKEFRAIENSQNIQNTKDTLNSHAEKKEHLITNLKVTTNTEIETAKNITVKENHHTAQSFKVEEVPNFVKELVLKIYPQGKHEAKIKLDPPELGEIHVTVSIDKGEVKLLLTVGHTKAAEALQQHLHQLGTSLENLGLQFSGAEINLAQQQSNENHQETGYNLNFSGREKHHKEEGENYKKRDHQGLINIVV
ncbi:flagellar hook-length control protein FliK [Thermodesulfatator autotrophicus]|uniref:Flagellar hook-length control protein-like C-terminal domain-containing protein n=1 Tax=Thermodesulfatator autotrophicus TaxID=1795632 RepID=A0A177E7C5_9BACT|nr:flagellar hook-length control protein FliK [Thermodesulfatator autotrophicus]OAG27132.1 hypothetical protein TH606_08460 [Thermodesulfatator autotrophicus]